MTNKSEFELVLRKSFGTFLSVHPLYKKFEIYSVHHYIRHDKELIFSGYCKKDKAITNFKFENPQWQALITRLHSSARAINVNLSMPQTFCDHYTAKCQACGEFESHFIIHGYSTISKTEGTKFFYEKAGQFPGPIVIPEDSLKKYFNDEQLMFFKKGKSLINENLGIGGFAYWRRNVEHVIFNLIDGKISSDADVKPILEGALKNYKAHPNMQKLLEAFAPYVPKPIKLPDGSNPLDLMYMKLSEGIHVMNEDECTEISSEIESLLEHVIKHINTDIEDSETLKAANKLRGPKKKNK
jgi:hypothetical protein